MTNRLLLLHLLSFGLVFAVHGQTPQLRFTRLTAADGLSQSSVLSILQDHEGFMWFGTQNGVNHFDGYTFTHYRYDPDDSTSLSYDWTRFLAEDHDGALWVGTADGLDRFDRSSHSFTRYHHDPTDPASLKRDNIAGVYVDQQGTLWVTAGGFLNRFNPGSETFTHYDLDEPELDDLASRGTGGVMAG